MKLSTRSQKLLVGVDVGGTKVATLVTDCEGNKLARTTMPTQLETPQATLEGIIAAVQNALKLAQAEVEDVSAVGLGIPGRVEPESGIVRMAVNLSWHDISARQALEEAFRVPCFLENDVRMAAMGLKYHPDFSSIQNLAYVSVGTGIAAGFVLNGKLYRGIHGMAGEIGHIEFLPGGPRCPCGAFGCLETLAAGPAIERMYAEAVPLDSFNDWLPKAGEIYEAASNGDLIANEIISKVSHFLGRAMKMIVMNYDLETIVFGGGVTRAGKAFLQPILQDIEIQRHESELASEMLRPEMFQLLPPDFDAALWGGIALAENGMVNSHKIFVKP